MVEPPPYTTELQARAFLHNVGRSLDDIAHAGADMAFFERNVRSSFASRSVMQRAVEFSFSGVRVAHTGRKTAILLTIIVM